MNNLLKVKRPQNKNHGNLKLLFIAILLAAIGLFFIFDLTPVDNTNNYAAKQAVGMAIGLVGAFLAYKIDYHFWKALGIFYIVVLFLAYIVFRVRGQMLSEIAKLVIVYSCLDKIKINLHEVVFFLNCLILSLNIGRGRKNSIIIYVMLIFNIILLGKSLIYVGNWIRVEYMILMMIIFIMMFVWNDVIKEKFRDILLLEILVIIGTVCLFDLEKATGFYPIHDDVSIKVIDGSIYISEDHPAFERSRDDIACGGAFGKGIGTFGDTDELYNDALERYIMSGIIKEVGWFGIALILVLYLLFLFEMVKIACQTVDKRGFNLAAGIAIRFMTMFMFNLITSIAFQSDPFLRMPFISYGPIGVMIDCFLVGIMLNVSRRAQQGDWGMNEWYAL